MNNKHLQNSTIGLPNWIFLPVLAILLFVAPIFQGKCIAQNWASIGKFNQAPYTLWMDSLEDRLYVAGSYTWHDSTEIHGFGYLEHDSVFALGCGFGFGGDTLCGKNTSFSSRTDAVTGIARFQGQLYVTGTFDFAGGKACNGLAAWQGSDWASVGVGINGYGNGLKVFNDELYVYGVFDSVNGIAANGLAKFDGQNWHNVFDLPLFENISNPNNISDIEWYNGELYIVGNFSKFGTDPPIRDIAKWNGTDWVAVEMGMYGGFGYLKRLDIFQGKLIIAGAYNPIQNPNSIPGHNIVAWDGQNWDTLQGGLKRFGGQNGIVTDILVHDDAMYVLGYFDIAGNLACNNIAKWDGSKWCGSSDRMDLQPLSIAFYHDTLHIVGPFNEINGDSSLGYYARWDRGEFGDNCVGVNLNNALNSWNDISLYPNPANTQFSLQLPPKISSCNLRIYDIAGREVMPSRKYSSGEVDVSALAAGMYFVEMQLGKQRQSLKLVKE